MRVLVFAAFLFSASAAFGADTAAEYDSYGGCLALTGQKTGWFHVQEIGGRWFFVTPEGNAFFSLGATHAIACITKDELGLFESKYHKDEEQLSQFILNHFKDWGYNSAGYGALGPMEKRLPYTAVIWIEGPMSLAAGTKTSFTDVFDAVVQERIRKTIRKEAARHVENKNCLGYYFLDLPTWHNSFNRTKPAGSYVDFFRNLGPDAPGKKAYVKFIEEHYSRDIVGFNAAYGLDLKSFDELQTIQFPAAVTKKEKVVADDELFLNRVADAYYACATTELRKIDPHHLILGDRFMADSAKTHDSILKTASKYVDVISFQPMGTKNLLGDYIDKVHTLTGKPVLLGDVNCVLERPAKDLAETEAYERAVGTHTQSYYLEAAARRSCIGIHRCTIRDYQPWNPQFFRTGLLQADDTPYPILSQYTRSISEQLYSLVYSRTQAAVPGRERLK